VSACTWRSSWSRSMPLLLDYVHFSATRPPHLPYHPSYREVQSPGRGDGTCLFLAGLITCVYLSLNLSIGAANVDYCTHFVQWWSTRRQVLSLWIRLCSQCLCPSLRVELGGELVAIRTARPYAIAGPLHTLVYMFLENCQQVRVGDSSRSHF
jgi:hypothetical protein